MGNEFSTLGGAVVTTGSAVAAGVTFGQVQTLNDAVVDSAKYTANHAEKTVVRHVGETLVMAVATAGASVASGVTLGQVDALNDAVVHCAKRTSLASQRSGSELLSVADGLSDGIPGVGHVKGGICYAVGDKERGDRAMKSSSRSVSVLGGGVKGYLVAGPVGAIAGGILAGAAMDGTITGIESSIHKEFRPHGQIASWNQVATATTSDERIGGIVSGVMTPVTDGFSGFAAGKTVHMVTRHSQSVDVPTIHSSTPTNDGLMRIPGVKSLKEAMNNWKQHQQPVAVTADGGGGFLQQATDALGGIFASKKAVDALQEAVNNRGDTTKGTMQQLWNHAMNNWTQQPQPVAVTADGSSGLFKQATDALGGIFASSKTGEALQEAVNNSGDTTKTAVQQLWDQATVKIKDAIEQKLASETSSTQQKSSIDEGDVATITYRLTGESGAFRAKEILLALLVVYMAAIMLTSHK